MATVDRKAEIMVVIGVIQNRPFGLLLLRLCSKREGVRMTVVSYNVLHFYDLFLLVCLLNSVH